MLLRVVLHGKRGHADPSLALLGLRVFDSSSLPLFTLTSVCDLPLVYATNSQLLLEMLGLEVTNTWLSALRLLRDRWDRDSDGRVEGTTYQ